MEEGGVTYWTSKRYFSYISLSEQEKGTKERWLKGRREGGLKDEDPATYGSEGMTFRDVMYLKTKILNFEKYIFILDAMIYCPDVNPLPLVLILMNSLVAITAVVYNEIREIGITSSKDIAGKVKQQLASTAGVISKMKNCTIKESIVSI